MQLRHALPLASLALLGLGCGRTSTDASPVLVRVGRESISEKDVQDLVNVLAPDAVQRERLLGQEGRATRMAWAQQLASQKAMVQMAEMEGLDKDPKAKLLIESAVAKAYGEVLLGRMAAKLEPSEAQLKDFYATIAAQRKAMGQETPAFEQVKPQLVQGWQQQQMERLRGDLEKEIAQKVPTTFAQDAKVEAPLG